MKKISTVLLIVLLSFLMAALVSSPVEADWWSEPTQLTDNTGDGYPSISGDGNKIAFVSDLHSRRREVFVVNSDDTGLKQVNFNDDWGYDSDPSISDDGNKIAFASNKYGNDDMFVVNSDSTGLEQLTFRASWSGYPSISGDGNKIAFQMKVGLDMEIYVVNSDASGLEQVTDNPTEWDLTPSISDDGSKIAFASEGGIFVIDPGGIDRRQLTTHPDFHAAERPSISGDGSKIAFQCNVDGDPDIYVVDSDGSDLRPLTFNNEYDRFPSISDDGSKIAFESDMDGDMEIYVVNSDASGLKQVTDNTAWDGAPSISDDGSKIAFASGGGIFLVSQDVNAPVTEDDYDDEWHTTDFTITVNTTDDLSEVAETYYIINDEYPAKKVSDGQPSITTESSNNRLEYWSVDNAENEEEHHVLTGIKLDMTAPTGSVTINNDATYATSTSVTLTLTATDDTSGVYQVRLSNDGEWDTELWEDFSTSKPWTLTAEDGTKTVYYQIKDNAGLDSDTYSDTIILETGKASSSTSISISAIAFTVGESTTISGSLSPPVEGVNVTIQYRPSGGSWTTLSTVTTGSDGGYSYTWTPTTAGTYEVKASWEGDETTMSNQSRGQTVEVQARAGAPAFPMEFLAAGIGGIVIVAAVLAYLKWRKPKEEIPRPSSIRITAEPTELLADGKSKSTITIQLLDKEGKPVKASPDIEVKLETTGGKLESPAVKILKGKEVGKTLLVSSTESGEIRLSAVAKRLRSVDIGLTFVEKARFCMGCGARMSVKDKRCSKCGASPEQFTGPARICKSCERRGPKTYLPLTAQFCSECGASQPKQGE